LEGGREKLNLPILQPVRRVRPPEAEARALQAFDRSSTRTTSKVAGELSAVARELLVYRVVFDPTAGEAGILEQGDDGPALALGIRAAEPLLVLNRR
jgi:hypothetical protein